MTSRPDDDPNFLYRDGRTVRTVETSDYDGYVHECPASAADRANELAARQDRMARFPFAVMLKLSYAELDFTHRWCRRQFGPGDGECHETHSEYRSCSEPAPHAHTGCWASHWFEKTSYNFGFNEWYFESRADRDRFVAYIPDICWGEHYGK